MAGTILVIGSTGRVGSELIRLLVQKGETVRGAARHPSQQRFSPSVEAVHFDFDEPETFAPALKGVDRLFLMARPGDNHSDKAAAPLIDEAKKQSMDLVVNLTAMGVEQDETFMLRVLEKCVEASGMPFVHLRPNWFMQNFDSGPIFADIRATRAIHLPAADAELSFIDVRDIAAVACDALTKPRHAGNAYTLTGAEALSHFAVAEKLTSASGTTVTYVPISAEAARAGLEARGVPSGYIERWADFFLKVRMGLCAPVSSDLEKILGRPAILFDRYAKDFAEVWR
jgi:uncharacterized protein YbjT (DUF2867 family)